MCTQSELYINICHAMIKTSNFSSFIFIVGKSNPDYKLRSVHRLQRMMKWRSRDMCLRNIQDNLHCNLFNVFIRDDPNMRDRWIIMPSTIYPQAEVFQAKWFSEREKKQYWWAGWKGSFMGARKAYGQWQDWVTARSLIKRQRQTTQSPVDVTSDLCYFKSTTETYAWGALTDGKCPVTYHLSFALNSYMTLRVKLRGKGEDLLKIRCREEC